MSKAFTKESNGDDADEAEITAPQIPKGAKNYMTPGGVRRMQEELRDLLYRERPEVVNTVSWAAGNGDRSENGDYLYGKKRLREIDRRVRFLSKRLDLVEVVDPLAVACEQVRFGATVTIADEDDNRKTYSIVGVDEADASIGRISWASPLANALMKAKVGDVVMFRSPRGVQEIEIIEILYKTLE